MTSSSSSSPEPDPSCRATVDNDGDQEDHAAVADTSCHNDNDNDDSNRSGAAAAAGGGGGGDDKRGKGHQRKAMLKNIAVTRRPAIATTAARRQQRRHHHRRVPSRGFFDTVPVFVDQYQHHDSSSSIGSGGGGASRRRGSGGDQSGADMDAMMAGFAIMGRDKPYSHHHLYSQATEQTVQYGQQLESSGQQQWWWSSSAVHTLVSGGSDNGGGGDDDSSGDDRHVTPCNGRSTDTLVVHINSDSHGSMRRRYSSSDSGSGSTERDDSALFNEGGITAEDPSSSPPPLDGRLDIPPAVDQWPIEMGLTRRHGLIDRRRRRRHVSRQQQQQSLRRALASAGRKPQAEVYGFVQWIVSMFCIAFYLLWSFLPENFMHWIGITYYPDKYWALAVPAYFCVLVMALVFGNVILFHLKVLPLDSRGACYLEHDSEDEQDDSMNVGSGGNIHREPLHVAPLDGGPSSEREPTSPGQKSTFIHHHTNANSVGRGRGDEADEEEEDEWDEEDDDMDGSSVPEIPPISSISMIEVNELLFFNHLRQPGLQFDRIKREYR